MQKPLTTNSYKLSNHQGYLVSHYLHILSSSLIQTLLSASELTMFHRIMPLHNVSARGLYRRYGISPCPEDFIFHINILHKYNPIIFRLLNTDSVITICRTFGIIIHIFLFFNTICSFFHINYCSFLHWNSAILIITKFNYYYIIINVYYNTVKSTCC